MYSDNWIICLERWVMSFTGRTFGGKTDCFVEIIIVQPVEESWRIVFELNKTWITSYDEAFSSIAD